VGAAAAGAAVGAAAAGAAVGSAAAGAVVGAAAGVVPPQAVRISVAISTTIDVVRFFMGDLLNAMWSTSTWNLPRDL